MIMLKTLCWMMISLMNDNINVQTVDDNCDVTDDNDDKTSSDVEMMILLLVVMIVLHQEMN